VAVTPTATVAFLSGAPSARVDFYDGDALIGSGTLSSAGTATLTTSALAIGSRAITARYAGAGDVPPSRSPVFVQTTGGSGAKPKASTTALSSAPNASTLETAVDLSVDVVGLPALLHGRHIVTATYLGDSSYKGSTAAVTQTVN
jgi:hypothetical protein